MTQLSSVVRCHMSMLKQFIKAKSNVDTSDERQMISHMNQIKSEMKIDIEFQFGFSTSVLRAFEIDKRDDDDDQRLIGLS